MFSLIFWGFIIYLIVRSWGKPKKVYRWLQEELPRWEEKMLISREQGDTILKFYNLKRIDPAMKSDLTKTLSLIGAIFLGLGVLFLVGANWQKIPGLTKTVLLLTVTISTLYAGYLFTYIKEGYPQLGKSLFLLASLFWGATVALIGQIYHIPVSENWYIFLLWSFPILPVAIFFENLYTHLLASVLLIIWNFLYLSTNQAPNYFYPLIVFAVMLSTAKGSWPVRYINVMGLVSTSVYCPFYSYEWLALLIGAGLLVYYLRNPAERIFLYSANVALIFWTITFTTVRDVPNFLFLPVLVLLTGLSYKDNLSKNMLLCLLALVLWLNLTLHSFSKILDYKFEFSVSLIVLHSLLGIVFYIIGIMSKNRGRLFFELYKIFGYLLTFACVYLLSFPDVLKGAASLVNPLYLNGCLVLAGAIILLLFYEFRQGGFKNKLIQMELGTLLAAFAGHMLVLVNPSAVILNTLIGNTVLVIFALCNITLGVELKKTYVFNLGVAIFVLFILTRFIDVTWKLKEKSLFFIIGGILILVLGSYLEKQRRKFVERISRNE